MVSLTGQSLTVQLRGLLGLRPFMSWSPGAEQSPASTLMPASAQLEGPHAVCSEYSTKPDVPSPNARDEGRGGAQAQHMHAHTLVYKVKAHWPAWSFPTGGWCSLTAPSKRLISGAIDLVFPGNQL